MGDDPARPMTRRMRRRFALACALIALLAGGATATVALTTIGSFKPKEIPTPRGLVEPTGGPQTFLILGSDRRAKSKDSLDRTDPPHSDTILLVRFDPGQGQTSVLSIPRDLLVNIKSSTGASYPQEKINAAYTYGARLGGTQGSLVLAAETVKREVFPGLKLNGIIDVNFAGFIKVVDTLGCVYVNVDHRYLHINGEGGELYSEINLQPGYQKLCYNNALSYVRYRHGDSDFVRVARQQDFLRNLREQVSAGDVLKQIDHVAQAVGQAIVTSKLGRSGDLIQLAKLIGFSQRKPLRQVKFRAANTDYMLKGGSYVTSTPALERATLNDFLHGDERVSVPKPTPKPKATRRHARHVEHVGSATPASLGLVASPASGEEELAKGSIALPFRVLYPSLQTSLGELQPPVRTYELRDQANRLHHVFVIVWRQNTLGGYYDFEGSDWKKPPLISHPSETRTISGTKYLIFADGSHIHTIAWRQGKVLYWLTNTLLEDLSNEQMLAIARSARPLH
jgi:LCP family protein required for cell wall assembly